ncbi:MAG: alpha/beta fold hydrolase [Planctomycetaceae bacterium]
MAEDVHCEFDLPPHTVRWIEMSDGRQLAVRCYPASGDFQNAARGIVVCLHGIQSHSGWYGYSSQRMAEAGFHVYCADRRGSGLNTEDRGHADHGLRLIHDVRQLVDTVREEHSGMDVTLLGLSWGGKTAAALAALFPDRLQQLVLLSPGLQQKIRPTRWQNFLLSAARRHDVTRYRARLPLDDPALFTSSISDQDRIRRDGLSLKAVTTGLLNSGRDLDEILRKDSHRIRHRTLLMLAGYDRIVDNDGVRREVCRFSSNDLTIVRYSDATHTLEFEPNRDQIVTDLVNWLCGSGMS